MILLFRCLIKKQKQVSPYLFLEIGIKLAVNAINYSYRYIYAMLPQSTLQVPFYTGVNIQACNINYHIIDFRI